MRGMTGAAAGVRERRMWIFAPYVDFCESLYKTGRLWYNRGTEGGEMKREKTLQRGVCVAVSALFAAALCAAPLGVSANSALYLWEGSAAGGVAVVGGECPVTVESETLVFTINDLPTDYGDARMEEYEAHVTAAYSFYNPAAYEVKMTLAFPYGRMPEYVQADFDPASRCAVTADGASVSVRERVTYQNEYEFVLEEGLARLSDTFAEDSFFAPDLPVTVYGYKVESEYTGDFYAHVTFPELDTDVSRAFVSGDRYYAGDGYAANVQVKNGEVVWVAVAGEPAEAAFRLFEGTDGSDVQARLRQVYEGECTFEQLALYYYAGEEEGKTDWYNAVVAALNERETYIPYSFSDMEMQGRLLHWLEYELTVPAGGRVTNAVTAPLYPRVSRVSSSRRTNYRYSYYLSPAQTWAAFGSLSVEVRTPYELSSCNHPYERTEEGYSIALDTLPDGELYFTLHDGQPHTGDLFVGWLARTMLIAAAVIIVAVSAGLLTWALIRRKKQPPKGGNAPPQGSGRQ